MIHGYMFDRASRETGLLLLKVFCEEINSTKSDVPTARKDEIQSRFQQEVPGVLMMMQRLLDEAYERPSHSRSVTQAPSPVKSYSPNHPGQGAGSFGNLSTAFIHSADTSDMPSTWSLQFCFASGPPRGNFDEESQRVCSLALEIIYQLFQWIPVNQWVTMSLFDTLLKFSQINDASNVSLGITAMNCIDELIVRKFSPGQQGQEFLMLIFKYLYDILKYLTDDIDNNSIDDLDEEYVLDLFVFLILISWSRSYRSKFTALIATIVEHQFHQFLANEQFPTMAFLDLLYKYTFHQPNIHAMHECWLIWNNCIDYTVMQYKDASNHALRDKLRHQLLSFGTELLNRMRYMNNAAELSDVEDGLENEHGETDYDLFLNDVLDIMFKLTELYPDDLVQLVCKEFENLCLSFEAISGSPRNDGRLIEETAHIYYVFKDLRTYLRIIGRLSEMFTEKFEPAFNLVYGLLTRVLGLIELALHRFIAYQDFGDYPKLGSELFSIFKSYVYWLVLFNQRGEAGENEELRGKFDLLCGSLFRLCFIACQPNIHDKITLAASQVFVIVVKSVKPSRLLTYPGVGEFLSGIHDLSASCTAEVKKNLYSGTSSACLNLFPADKNNFSSQYYSFVQGLTIPFAELVTNPEFYSKRIYADPQVFAKLNHLIVVLNALVDSVALEKTQAKIVLYDNIRETIPHIMRLFVECRDNLEMVSPIMDFSVTLFSALRKQMGLESASSVLGTLITFLDGDRMTKLLNDEKGSNLVCKFLSLLMILVEDNSKMFDSLLPSVISFCLHRCAPILKNSDIDNPEQFAFAYFSLVESIIWQNWRYFFPRSGVAKPKSPVDPALIQSRLQEFYQLLETVIVSFSQSSIEIFKKNLAILDNLNSKCRLYTQNEFATNMLSLFLAALLDSLTDKYYSSLKEEILHTVFMMACVDIDVFFAGFLPNYVQKINSNPSQLSLLQSQMTKVSDEPSFNVQISRLADDLNFLKSLTNNSGPLSLELAC